MERDAQQVVVVGLLLHVDGDEVVEPLLVEEVLRLPADVGVWVQVLVVVEEVLRLPADVAPKHHLHFFLCGTLQNKQLFV